MGTKAPPLSNSHILFASAIESILLCERSDDEEQLFRALEAARTLTALLVDRARGAIRDSIQVTRNEFIKAEASDAGSHSPKRCCSPSLPPSLAEEREIGTRLAARQ
jgi:hypothetical protein